LGSHRGERPAPSTHTRATGNLHRSYQGVWDHALQTTTTFYHKAESGNASTRAWGAFLPAVPHLRKLQNSWVSIIERKDKSHIILSIGTEKAFDQIQHPSLIKMLKNIGVGGTHLNIIKATYERPTANILLDGAPTESFSPKEKDRTKAGMSTLTTLVQPSPQSHSFCNQTTKRHPSWQRRTHTITLCRHHESLYRLPERLHKKIAGTDIQTQ